MGSGCSKGFTQGVCAERVYDQCVFYTGEPIEELEICTLDTYAEIIKKVLDFMTKDEPTYEALVSKCDKISELLDGKDPILSNMLDVIITLLCQHTADIEDIKEVVYSDPFVYDLKCLVLADVSTEKIVQKLIDVYCSLQDRVAILESTVDALVGDDGLAISTEHPDSMSTVGGEVHLMGFVKPWCPLPYIGPLSNFDLSGAGLESKGFKNWYIMNGQNGTPDWRGFAFAGATSVTGGPLNPLVDPATLGADYSTGIGDTKGKARNKLVVSNLPDHTHTTHVEQYPHKHNIPFSDATPGKGGDDGDIGRRSIKIPPYLPYYLQTENAMVDLSVNITGTPGATATPIDNRQPTKYGVWIVWIP